MLMVKQRVLICDYRNVLEHDYEPTKQSVLKAYADGMNCSVPDIKDKIEFEIYPYKNDEELIKKLDGAEGIITGFLEIGEKILSAAKSLSFISVSGVGYSNVDMNAAGRYDVKVCHIREYCTQEVAEHTFALICALNRNLKYYTYRIEKEHEWKYHTINAEKNLTSQVLAIFGFGKIGKRVASIAKSFGMKVIAVDPYLQKNEKLRKDIEKSGVEIVSSDKAFECADIITNHMNLTAENYHFFNEETFKLMKNRPIFINVGRGGSVDETALEKALNSGIIRAAGLDVLEAEEPNLELCRLLGRKNVLITPHSAFYSSESIEKLQTISGANMGYCLCGKYEKTEETVNV